VPGAVTKNGKPLAVPLSGPLLKVIRRRWAVRVAACPHVFHRGGRPIKDFRTAWTNACKAAGVPGRIVHDFRRTAVRNLERAGVSRSVARKMTGHKTEAVYRRYAIASEGDLRDAAKKLGALVQEVVQADTSSLDTIGLTRRIH